jgi:hypothetical protein
MASQKKIYGLDKPIFRLRWGFDFFDGKPSRRGIWNNTGALATDGAWCVNKTNLLRAYIEAENVLTWEIETLWQCDGQDFVNFEWIAATPIDLGAKVSRSYSGQIVGLAGISRDYRDAVFIDGSARRQERTEYEKQNLLAGWRK